MTQPPYPEYDTLLVELAKKAYARLQQISGSKKKWHEFDDAARHFWIEIYQSCEYVVMEKLLQDDKIDAS